MAQRSKPQQTRLRITGCSATYHGKHPNGHEYTIYDIEADKEDGTPVQEELRAFEELPIGEPLDLNVVKYEDGSFTLSRRGGSGNAAKIKSLEGLVGELVGRLQKVEQALGMEVSDGAGQESG